MQFLLQVQGAQPERGLSAVWRNSACDPDVPLASKYLGSSTCWETFQASVRLHGPSRCLGERTLDVEGRAGPYLFQSYQEVFTDVQHLGQSLLDLGVCKGSRVGIYGINSPAWIKTMIACSSMGAVCVPLYDTLAPQACSYIIMHSEIHAVFVQDIKLHNLTTAIQRAAGCAAPAGDDDSQACDGRLAVQHVVIWGRDTLATPQQLKCKAALKDMGVQVHTFDVLLTGMHGKLYGQTARSRAPDQSTTGTTGLTHPGPEDLATIMYTSGTTGVPKGVMLSHRALVATVASQLTFITDPCGKGRLAAREQYKEHSIDKWGDDDESRLQAERRRWPQFQPGDAHLSYLPLAHIYERALLEAALAVGAAIGTWQGHVDHVQSDAHALKPKLFVGVPRVWERVVQGVQQKLARRTAIARMLFRHFYQTKLRRLRTGCSIKAASPLGDILVFRKVREALGGQLQVVVSGAAPLPTHLEEFIRTTMCAYAGQGYGLTETCSATFVSVPDRWDMLGTVGPVQTCADMRLRSVTELGYDALADPPRGELLLRGPCVFDGYYRNPTATAEVLDDQGWFATGDIVELQPTGAAKIIDRIKNMVKLSQGEYVPLEAVETVLKDGTAGLVDMVWLYADSTRRYCVAVVVPNKHALLQWWSTTDAGLSQGSNTTWSTVCSSQAAHTHVLAQLREAAATGHLPTFQHPAAVILEPEPWTPEMGMLTPTHKLKRHALQSHYQRQLNDLYLHL